MKQTIQRLWARLIVWVNQHRKILIIGLVSVLVIEVTIQVAYPRDRTLPFARVGDQKIGFQPIEQLAQVYQQGFSALAVEVTAKDNQENRPVSTLGGSLDIDAMTTQAHNYPLAMRLVPFSLLWYRATADHYVITFDDARLQEGAAGMATALSREAVSAGVEVRDETVVTTSAQAGWQVEAQAVQGVVRDAVYTLDRETTMLTLEPAAIDPSVTDAEVLELRTAALGVLESPLQLVLPDRPAEAVSKATIASWIAFHKADNGELSLGVNGDGVAAYIAALSGQVGVKPTETTIQYTNGVETARTNGTPGKAINGDEITKTVTDFVTTSGERPKTITVSTVAVPSPVKRVSQYSSSQAGLQAYVNDQTADGSVKISVRQLGGNGWSAEGRAWESTVSASTYKPYVMMRMLEDIDSGSLQWSSQIAGMSADTCLEQTIVVSANACSEALIDQYGGRALTEYLRGKGFSGGTGFIFSDAAHTTAGDLTSFMTRLEQGSLVSGANRDRLLGAMRRQVYRNGVPAGTSAPVADKVGFLWDYLNDTAIVYHPQGTYVITVLTKGRSWQTIADITRQVEMILYG